MPATLAAVRALLEPGESLADASTWADEVRRDRPESGPWHYVNVPITEPAYSAEFCPKEGCVVAKIADFRKVLADRPRRPRRAPRGARFLVHFVQDLHQPLHVGDRGDRGGNDLQVQFFGQGLEPAPGLGLGLIEQAIDRRDGPDSRPEAARVRPRSAAVVARDSPRIGRTRACSRREPPTYDPGTGALRRRGRSSDACLPGGHLPVARTGVAQSGVRLARLLNETLGLKRREPGRGRRVAGTGFDVLGRQVPSTRAGSFGGGGLSACR